MRLIQMFTFFTLIALIFLSAHYYCYNRIYYYLGLTGHARIMLGVAFAFMGVGTFLAMPYMRSLPLEQAKILAFIIFPWMGILLLMFTVFLVADLFMGILLLSENQSLQDPGKRTFIKQVIGMVALSSVGGLSAISLWNGTREATIKPVAIKLKRLPEAFNGFHIAQLTDVHIGPLLGHDWINHVVDRTNALGADMIVITGDLVDGHVHEIGPIVKELVRLKAKHGVYFITGNHEYYSGVDEWVEFVKGLGITVLSNERVPITVNGSTIDLAGTEDFNSGNEDLKKALANRDPGRAVILLAHQPVSVTEAATMNVDLQLSGHTHGGQIRPFDYAVKLRQPYVRGLHQVPESDTQIYVSCGTGFWGPPMRLGTTSEITSIKLYKA